MIAEGIQQVQALVRQSDATPLTETVIKKSYTGSDISVVHQVDRSDAGRFLGKAVEPAGVHLLKVTTLTGFVDAIKAQAVGPEGMACIIHVEDHLNVSLKTAKLLDTGERFRLMLATYKPAGAFEFDSYYTDPQKFIIAIQTAFYVNEDAVYLQRLASNLSARSEVNTQDDGISQRVTVKTGEVSTAEVALKPRVKLIPRRTFDEAPPVESEFLIRLRQTPQQTPAIAIFDVEGTKWQGDSMRAIKSYLEKQITNIPVIA